MHLDIWYILLILLVTARLFSELARRIKIPSLAGEMTAGIVIGLVLTNFSGTFPDLAQIHENEVFQAITELGMFFLMLFAGIELHYKSLKKASGNALWVAVGGMIIPLGLGMGLGWFSLPDSELKSAQVFFLGVALAITAVPVAIKVLLDLNKLQSKSGQTIVSAAVIDDIISLLLLALLTSFMRTGELPTLKGLGILSAKIALFFAITMAIGLYILPYVAKNWLHKMGVAESEMSFLLVVALGFSVLAEVLGMHFILGAFIAGLFFAKREVKEDVYEDVKKKVQAITSGFLAPIFFASIGLSLNISALVNIPLFVVGLILIASIGKIMGAGMPAKLTGLSTNDSLIVGNAMNARGAVELIIADIALRAGLFEQPGDSELVANLFSAVVIMAIVTTLITPLILKKLATPNSS
ncbi:cation:proton antiporter [Draconibacterium halophilum]|uniref:Cation:proton antiporter n=1 Tax=Draconibacterium halophilum TaxID=2706887 RepID=A0A6C0REZ5_9BACT|nr:cation:proton antiporter [Draconibacterium halophilum]QIA09084.1 cation:proton antiporter [Draconibacterium halophilum]